MSNRGRVNCDGAVRLVESGEGLCAEHAKAGGIDGPRDPSGGSDSSVAIGDLDGVGGVVVVPVKG